MHTTLFFFGGAGDSRRFLCRGLVRSEGPCCRSARHLCHGAGVRQTLHAWTLHCCMRLDAAFAWLRMEIAVRLAVSTRPLASTGLRALMFRDDPIHSRRDFLRPPLLLRSLSLCPVALDSPPD